MGGYWGTDGQQSGDDQGCRKQSLGAPSLGENASGYLRANVAPEERAEDSMLHRFVPMELLREKGETRVSFLDEVGKEISNYVPRNWDWHWLRWSLPPRSPTSSPGWHSSRKTPGT